MKFTGGGLDIARPRAPAHQTGAGPSPTARSTSGDRQHDQASGAGTALNVASTAIGAAGLTFQSISAGTGGAPRHRHRARHDRELGGLTVTGTGTAGRGGTIQHKTGTNSSTTWGIGIYLNNTPTCR